MKKRLYSVTTYYWIFSIYRYRKENWYRFKFWIHHLVFKECLLTTWILLKHSGKENISKSKSEKWTLNNLKKIIIVRFSYQAIPHSLIFGICSTAVLVVQATKIPLWQRPKNTWKGCTILGSADLFFTLRIKNYDNRNIFN